VPFGRTRDLRSLRPELRAAITAVDAWEIAEGARMVTRAEFESALPIGSMVTQVLTKLLAIAADKSGRIAHYEPGEIFDTHILAAMEMEPDDVTTAIRYDAWTAMVMSESVYLLVNAGFLAHRGGGDHAAYHLALPNAEH
jgi:hypothetical protein